MLGNVVAKPAPRRSAPLSSHTIVMASRAIEQQVFNLRSHGVLLTSTEPFHAANPLLVGKVLEAELRIPPHLLRVTCHHPEAFFVRFDMPNPHERAVRLGRITVEGAEFLIQAWRESEHAVFQTYPLHVRVCIERMPLHLWSLEGAELVLGKDGVVDRLDSRTYAQNDTVLFSCWIWAWSLDRIPGHHGLSVLPQGAGRVAEMNGFSPPRRDTS